MRFSCFPSAGTVARGFLFLTSLAFLSKVHANTLGSEIRSVGVFADRALVTRVGTTNLTETGVTELEFCGLPQGLEDQSLQVKGSGSAKVSILNVTTKSEFLSVPASERIQALEGEITRLVSDTDTLNGRQQILGQQEVFVGQLLNSAAQPPAQGQARPGLEEWTKLMAYQSDVLSKIFKERRDLAAEKRLIDDKVAALRAQLAELRSGSGRTVKKVFVRVRVESPGSLELSLSYQLGGATWRPVYIARVSGEDGKVSLGYQGMVVNATGEDWNNVALTLSTAKPSLGGGVPTLPLWVVDVVKMPRPMPVASSFKLERDLSPRNKLSFSYGGKTEGGNADGVELSAFSAPAAIDQYNVATGGAELSQSLSSANFRVEGLATVKADSSVQRIPITQLNLSAAFELRVVPKLQPIAFLYAKVDNGTEFPLLAGAVDVYLDGNFVASSPLKAVMPGEKFELALGADESVSLKRRLAKRFVENTGIASKGLRTSYEYDFSLTNHKRGAASVLVMEPIPVSRNEQIIVKLLEPSEKELAQKSPSRDIRLEEGQRLVWHFDLKSGEKRDFSLRYQIEHPAELPVSGVE